MYVMKCIMSDHTPGEPQVGFFDDFIWVRGVG